MRSTLLPESRVILVHLATIVECSPEVDLNRRDDIKRRDVEVDNDSKRHDLLVGSEVGDGYRKFVRTSGFFY